MKNSLKKVPSVILGLICIISMMLMPVHAAPQGTNGDELHVVEAQHLEIQLGTEWSGVEFMLRTDAGVYPGTITVGDDGVLCLEIGGSKNYILSCMQSSVAIPEVLLQAPVTNEAEPDKDDLVDIEDKEPAIPTSHIIMFVVGIIVAVGILIAIYISNKRRQSVQDDEDDDDY